MIALAIIIKYSKKQLIITEFYYFTCLIIVSKNYHLIHFNFDSSLILKKLHHLSNFMLIQNQ